MQQWTGTWSAGAGGRALQSASFLNDAFQQLDEVLKRKAEAQAQQPPPPPTQELKASQQMIQRWLVIFARDHPADICEKLMAAAMEHSATAVPARSLPKQQLPTKSDEHDSRSELRGDGSIDYFLLDSLRRVLAAAAADESGAALRAVCEQLRSAEKGGGDHSGRDPAQPGLLDFCYSRISVVYSAPIRHVASECVGLLSAARLKPVVEMFLASLARVTSDRDEREFVPSMRATRLLQLSTHSAEQAAASLAYLKALVDGARLPRRAPRRSVRRVGGGAAAADGAGGRRPPRRVGRVLLGERGARVVARVRRGVLAHAALGAREGRARSVLLRGDGTDARARVEARRRRRRRRIR